MPLIGRTLEKMPTERVGGSGVDIIVGRARGGEIDIARIAQSRDRRAVVERPDIERDRR